MKLMRDFLCPVCQTLTERYGDGDIREIDCECGAKAIRIIGMPTVLLEGITGDFPGAHDRWARVREARHRKKANNRDS